MDNKKNQTGDLLVSNTFLGAILENKHHESENTASKMKEIGGLRVFSLRYCSYIGLRVKCNLRFF